MEKCVWPSGKGPYLWPNLLNYLSRAIPFEILRGGGMEKKICGGGVCEKIKMQLDVSVICTGGSAKK